MKVSSFILLFAAFVLAEMAPAACGGRVDGVEVAPDETTSDAAAVVNTPPAGFEAGAEGSASTANAPVGTASGGGTCGTYPNGGVACDHCIAGSQCCEIARNCADAGSGGVDDAGASRCEQVLRCIVLCTGGDAGVAPPPSFGACREACSVGYEATEQLNAIALESCAGLFCPASCPGSG